jgi:hypothetical protein
MQKVHVIGVIGLPKSTAFPLSPSHPRNEFRDCSAFERVLCKQRQPLPETFALMLNCHVPDLFEVLSLLGKHSLTR